jgi:hypothetical protein
MSEYQYYEFLAIDRPLTAEETRALRSLSTRAQITPVSFTNEYNWGDFKGNPDKLMHRYFEAHALMGTQKCFQQELKKFMTRHMRRRALIQRMIKAGIWKEK